MGEDVERQVGQLGLVTGQQFVEDDAQRVNVAAAGQRFAFGLFGGGVIKKFAFGAVDAGRLGVGHKGHAEIDQDGRAILA